MASVGQAGNQKKPVYEICKRCFDIVLALVALIVLFVPLVIIALVIVIDSPGASPIFVQKRVGKNGKIFNFYKFRSMVPNAESMLNNLLDQNEMTGPVFKMKEDPRITRIGKFIRSCSIDELPQLVNILKGDMSFVGPRPERAYFYAEFDKNIPHFKYRLLVQPGLTGHAQVNGGYDLLPEEKIVYDLEYMAKRSVKMDLQCLFKTVLVVLTRNGAR